MKDQLDPFDDDFEIDPLALPPALNLGPGGVAAHNRALRRVAPAEIELEDVTFALTPRDDGPSPQTANVIWFGLRGPGPAIWLGIGHRLLDMAFRHLIGDTAATSTWAHDLQANLVFDPVLTRLEAKLDHPVTVTPAPAPLPDTLCRHFKLSVDGIDDALLVAAAPEAFPLVEDLLALLPVAPDPAWHPAVATALIIGAQHVPKDALAGLIPGAALLPHPTDLAVAAATLSLAGRPRATMVVAGDQAIVTTPSPPAPPHNSPGRGEIRVTFEICCPSISYQDAQSLAVGQRIAIGAALDEAEIEVRVGHRRFARGRLIHVGTHRAIQVIKIEPNVINSDKQPGKIY